MISNAFWIDYLLKVYACKLILQSVTVRRFIGGAYGNIILRIAIRLKHFSGIDGCAGINLGFLCSLHAISSVLSAEMGAALSLSVVCRPPYWITVLPVQSVSGVLRYPVNAAAGI